MIIINNNLYFSRRKERSAHNALRPTIFSPVDAHVISHLDLNVMNIVLNANLMCSSAVSILEEENSMF